jgi:hypothetical protein
VTGRARRPISFRHRKTYLVGGAQGGGRAGVWVVLGSLAVKVEGEERAANRTFVIDARGDRRAL